MRALSGSTTLIGGAGLVRGGASMGFMGSARLRFRVSRSIWARWLVLGGSPASLGAGTRAPAGFRPAEEAFAIGERDVRLLCFLFALRSAVAEGACTLRVAHCEGLACRLRVPDANTEGLESSHPSAGYENAG